MLVGAVFPSDPFPLPLEQVVRRQLTLTGIHNYAPRHLVQAINFLSVTHSRFPFAELVSHWVPLRECQSAFDQGREGHAIRVGVRPLRDEPTPPSAIFIVLSQLLHRLFAAFIRS